MPMPVMRLLPLALLACTRAPVLEIGTGELDFESLADGDDVQVIRGPQGGYHILGSLRMRGIEAGNTSDLRDPSNPTTSFRVLDGATQLAPFASFTQGIDDSIDDDWSHAMVGRLVILDITDDEEVTGREIRFEVEVATASGEVYLDGLDLNVVAHPLNDVNE
jgi:hypothetical protein